VRTRCVSKGVEWRQAVLPSFSEKGEPVAARCPPPGR